MGQSAKEKRLDPFRNREEAGKRLADRLSTLSLESPVLLAIPRGGVLVALPVARKLRLPLGLVPIRRLPVNWAKDIEIGYTTDTGELHLNQALIGQLRITRQQIYQLARKEQKALQQELDSWGARRPASLAEQTTVIVDEGLHSGWTMFSAVETVRKLGAKKIIVATPVSHFRAQRFVGRHCDQFVSLITVDDPLFHIADFYEQFPDVGDEQIRSAIAASSSSSETAA